MSQLSGEASPQVDGAAPCLAERKLEAVGLEVRAETPLTRRRKREFMSHYLPSVTDRTAARPEADQERTLCPTIAHPLGQPQSTATIASDYKTIRERVPDLELAAPGDGARLQELLYGMCALISIHFWKEEVEYLRLLDKHELTPCVCQLRLAGLDGDAQRAPSPFFGVALGNQAKGGEARPALRRMARPRKQPRRGRRQGQEVRPGLSPVSTRRRPSLS